MRKKYKYRTKTITINDLLKRAYTGKDFFQKTLKTEINM